MSDRRKFLRNGGLLGMFAMGAAAPVLAEKIRETQVPVPVAGVDPNNGDALFYKNKKGEDGKLDRSTTNKYSEAERVVVGDPNPDLIFGFTNNFSYNNIYFFNFFITRTTD